MVVSDVEADEIFTVLAGRATVEIRNGPTLELAPGVVGVLRAGDETVWHLHQTLRRVFHILQPPQTPAPGTRESGRRRPA